MKKQLYAEFAEAWDVWIDFRDDEIDFDLIKSIIKLESESEIPTGLVKIASMPLLKEKGQIFNVISGKKYKRVFNNNACYANAAKMMIDRGYGYVEGFVNRKGITFAHAWNVDLKGNHIDFTLDAGYSGLS